MKKQVVERINFTYICPARQGKKGYPNQKRLVYSLVSAYNNDKEKNGEGNTFMSGDKMLFPWQQECLERWEHAERHGIISVVTGAGKTFFALNAAKQMLVRDPDSLHVRIVVPTISLAYQWRSAILETMGNNARIGFFFGEVRSSVSLPWMIYVINSARYALSRHVLEDMENRTGVLLIADECHRYGSKENRKIFDFMKDRKFRPELYFSIGLSATPECRHLEDVLIPALGSVIYTYTLGRAVREKTISEFSVSQIRVSFNAEEQLQYMRLTRLIIVMMRNLRKKYPEWSRLSQAALFQRIREAAAKEGKQSPEQKLLDLTDQRRILCFLAEARASCVVDLVRNLPEDGRILVFCEMIEQANLLTALFREEGILKVGRCHSGMTAKARKTTLERYRDHEIRILVCCTALDEGLDVPDTAYGIVVSCSSVSRQRIQRLGRILRKSENKHLAGLYYLYLDRTVEDPVYIDEISRNHPVCNIHYLAQERCFMCPEYLELSDELLSCTNGTPEQLQTLRKNLMAGHVRNDWLMMPETLRSLADGTQDRKEKNYWIAMEKIAQKRIGTEKNAALSDSLKKCHESDVAEMHE